jgi:hypothetical protein
LYLGNRLLVSGAIVYRLHDISEVEFRGLCNLGFGGADILYDRFSDRFLCYVVLGDVR